MILTLYLIGVIISLVMFYKITINEKGEITIGDLSFSLLSFLSWFIVIVIIYVVILDNKDKVIYKRKNKKDDNR